MISLPLSASSQATGYHTNDGVIFQTCAHPRRGRVERNHPPEGNDHCACQRDRSERSIKMLAIALSTTALPGIRWALRPTEADRRVRDLLEGNLLLHEVLAMEKGRHLRPEEHDEGRNVNPGERRHHRRN